MCALQAVPQFPDGGLTGWCQGKRVGMTPTPTFHRGEPSQLPEMPGGCPQGADGEVVAPWSHSWSAPRRASQDRPPGLSSLWGGPCGRKQGGGTRTPAGSGAVPSLLILPRLLYLITPAHALPGRPQQRRLCSGRTAAWVHMWARSQPLGFRLPACDLGLLLVLHGPRSPHEGANHSQHLGR